MSAKSFLDRNRSIIAFLGVCVLCVSLLFLRLIFEVREVQSLKCLSKDAFVTGSESIETLQESLRNDFTLLKIVNDIAAKHDTKAPEKLLKERSYTRDTIDLETLKTIAALRSSHYPHLNYSDAVLDSAINRVLEGKCLFLTPFGNGEI